MTMAARPTWAPAKGGNEQGGTRIFGPSGKYSSRDLAAHTSLKPRKEGQQTQEELQKRNLREELEERESKHFSSKDKSYEDRDRQKSSSQLLLEGSRREFEDKIVPCEIDADDSDVEPRSDDESDEDDDDNDDTEALMAELERIKKERAEEKLRKDRQQAEEDGDRGDDDATPLLGDGGDDPKDGSSGPEDGSSGPESSEDTDDEIMPLGDRAVQLLAIRANFPICFINGYDSITGQLIYVLQKGEVQEEGMVDLVPVGPSGIFTAYGDFCLEVFYFTTTAGDEGFSMADLPIKDSWDVSSDDEVEECEYTQAICAGPGRKLEITYLVISNAIEANIKVMLKLKDIGSRSRAVYGKIKASATGFGNKSVHLFSRERQRSLSFPSGSTSILPVSPSVIAVPCCRQLKLHIEVDLTVITTCDSQEEQKNLKFSLEFNRGIRSQEREVDDDGVEMNIKFDPNV